MPNYSGRMKFPDLNQVSPSRAATEVLGVQNPIQAVRNFPVLIKFESGMKASSCNPGVQSLNPTDGHYSIF